MSSVTSQKSERSQTLIAVIFMSLFVTIFVIATARENITGFICNYVRFTETCPDRSSLSGSADVGQIIPSQISLACVDAHGLKILVNFDTPISGEAGIQVFTTGEDVFPTERGMSDSFEMSLTIPALTEQLDIIIPVETMPAGESIFGNIDTSHEQTITSHITFFTTVSDCATGIPDPGLLISQADAPINFNTTCLPNGNLMIAFEFDEPVQGQYQALVANSPYNLVAVGNQPAVLFFSGRHPGEDLIAIRLVSVTNQAVVFEETHALQGCRVE